MRATIDRYAAFLAHAHAAQRRARHAGYRGSCTRDASMCRKRSRYGSARQHLENMPVDGYTHARVSLVRVTHG
jgi:hypothetical protein